MASWPGLPSRQGLSDSGLHMRHPSNATDLPLIAGHFQ
ncbi:hypothetical protein I547_1635 [Mycobacterium kansasii 824]|uniref:Uncharacterized protein n=1 Tax=Mycobacterium kansasii TaxID=1768 RepID=A0A1V3WJ21_MYCKA|nr:hypothetical protein I547_1635 [Mycobacterium kansasii 824]KEP44057.1 hypothetical protein MKSMC1_08130 [Mycobacterium kansasii]OOK66977.1 hypothetical protein BZL29_7252 [Mycobacterium kansasii]